MYKNCNNNAQILLHEQTTSNVELTHGCRTSKIELPSKINTFVPNNTKKLNNKIVTKFLYFVLLFLIILVHDIVILLCNLDSVIITVT